MKKVEDEIKGLEGYEEDTRIDRDHLDEEWLLQPSLMRKYQRLKAQAARKLRRAQEKKKTVRSDLILKARGKDGTKLLKVDKMNDSVVESWYRLQPEYQDAVNEEIEAEYHYNMLEGAVSAITDKKHGLQNLVSLYQSEYWSDPKEPKGSGFEEKAQKKSADSRRESLGKKYKKRG